MNQEYVANAVKLIQIHGWMLQVVGGDEETSPFGYTVGLSRERRPEIIVVGRISPTLMQDCIASAIELPEWQDNMCSDDVLSNYPVMFREVTHACARQTALLAKRLFPDFRLFQMFLPDSQRRFPWHTDCERRFQAQLALEYVQDPPHVLH